ncbi:MAG: peptidylprolyl isomerase [Desulfobacterales bacterium]
MKPVIKIMDEAFTADQFVKFLKFSNEFNELAERFVRNRIIVRTAMEKGIKASDGEIQQAADDFRRCLGLHRVSDTQKWLDANGLNLDEFENFIREFVLAKKMMATVVTDETVENYFRCHSPRFDTVHIRHIVVRGESRAKELMSLLCEEPAGFPRYAEKYSIDEDTREAGGYVGEIRREMMPDEMQAKVFHAAEGDLLGPFRINGSEAWEIIRVAKKKTASLEDSRVRERVAEILHREWVDARLKDLPVNCNLN